MQITPVRNESRDITTNLIEIKNREYNEHLYAKKLDNLDEMDKLIERHKLPKLTEDTENLNRFITRDWISNQKPFNKEKIRTRRLHQ